MYFRVFILVMTKLNFQQPYLSLQYHMILQKSFWYPYWFLKKYFLSLLKTFFWWSFKKNFLKKKLLFDFFCTKYYKKIYIKNEILLTPNFLMVLNREIASPRNLDLKFILSTLSKEKHLFFSDFPHHQKFVLNIKINRINPPNKSKCHWTDAIVKWFQWFSGSLAVGQEMSPYQIHSMALYLGLELRGARERVVMVQTGIAGRNSWPPDWHNQWTACGMACCNHRCLGTKGGWR